MSRVLLFGLTLVGAATAAATPSPPVEPDADVAAALLDEQRRIETISRVSPAVVCIYDAERRGGGSGVIIDPAGYGLTNFHVVASMLASRRGLGGLPDGHLYELQVLGIDPGGDVAMFRLTGRDRFDFVELGDSDGVRVGDTVLAMGNPFLLAQDQTPTVTMGIVTGTHRYQWGTGNALVYSDCIQTDAAINPGNSGGPLFDIEGRVIGINGRISVAAGVRGRVNVGVGFAISSNQISRFLPAMRAGLLVRHGTLQATVNRDLLFNDLLEDGPAWKAGVRPGDRLLRFGGQDIESDNHFASILGTYPENWPVPVSFEHQGETRHAVVRLEPLSAGRHSHFDVDAEVNRRQARRAVEAVPSPAPGAGGQLSWTARRVPLDVGATATDDVQTWAYDYTPGGISTHQRLDEDGKVVRSIRCDADGAALVGGDAPEAGYAMSLSEELAIAALHALLVLQAGDVEAIDWDAASHAGSDEMLEVDATGRIVHSDLLEVVELRGAGNVTARVGICVSSHLVRQVVTRDVPTGAEAMLAVTDYRTIDGTHLPGQIEVRSGNTRYTESWPGDSDEALGP